MGDLSETPAGWAALPGWFPELGDSHTWLPLLQRHHALLLEAAPRISVTSVDAAEAPMRLYGESLETLRTVRDYVLEASPEVVDVGSGGGFPGMVLAAVMSSWRVTLIEPVQKRARLLDEMADALGLRNVTVMAARAEDAGRGDLRDRATLVTARAVAELREVLEYTAPLAKTGGVIALPKGSRLPDERKAAETAMQELRVSVEAEVACRQAVSATPWTLILRKTAPTPERYPRRAGIPRKRPL